MLMSNRVITQEAIARLSKETLAELVPECLQEMKRMIHSDRVPAGTKVQLIRMILQQASKAEVSDYAASEKVTAARPRRPGL